MMKRRTAGAYDMLAPVIIRIPVKRLAVSRADKAEDISARVVSVTIDKDRRAGTKLDLTMTLPAEVTCGRTVVCRATGQVVRVIERSANGNRRAGVVASIKQYEIARDKAAIA